MNNFIKKLISSESWFSLKCGQKNKDEVKPNPKSFTISTQGSYMVPK